MSCQGDRFVTTLGATIAAALLLLAPGLGEHLDEAGHDHDEALSVAEAAVHTTLPVHFEASSTMGERACSACLLQGRTVVRVALALDAAPLPPAVSLGAAPDARMPGRHQGRRDPSRAPPIVL